MFEGRVTAADADSITVDSADAGGELRALNERGVSTGLDVCLAVRPEKIFVSREEPRDAAIRLRGVVDNLGYFGNLSLYRIRLTSGKVIQVSAQNRQRSAERYLEWEDEIWVSWQPGSAVVLVD